MDKHGRNLKVPPLSHSSTTTSVGNGVAGAVLQVLYVLCSLCVGNGVAGAVLQVLYVLCSLCVGNGVAVRSNQNLICDNLLPGRDLLLQTKLVEHVFR